MLVHLSEWEWACCGDAFIAGDEVELQVVAPDAWVREKYGERGASVDAHETHHQVGADDAPTTAVRGRVRGIEAVYLGHTVRYEPRDPRCLVHEADEPPSGPVELFSGYLVELDPV